MKMKAITTRSEIAAKLAVPGTIRFHGVWPEWIKGRTIAENEAWAMADRLWNKKNDPPARA